jgi:hypothetical protein
MAPREIGFLTVCPTLASVRLLSELGQNLLPYFPKLLGPLFGFQFFKSPCDIKLLLMKFFLCPNG